MIAILGAGGVGGFLAGALARAGEQVTVIAREPTAELIERDGIRVESLFLDDDFTARPIAAPRLTEPGATLVVATKATALPQALDRIDAEPALVVPLLNGLEHMAVLRERFGPSRVAAGTIRVEADRPAPGRITQTSPFLRVDMAPPTEPVTALASVIERAGVPVLVIDSEAEVLWDKLVRLNALACTTSAHDLLLGAIRDDPERRAELDACVREAAAVAEAEGAVIDPDVVLAELGQAHATLGSSMQRDIAAGRPPELDAIPGAVMRAGARHGIATPTIARL
ncbi:MAG: 2-dehydropantoate 2-reductase, partial [Solirubrobacteraceae bacterium]|nr:2-dehydropantoate 2-reductase [Solirubrobacteraceae bacterium]